MSVKPLVALTAPALSLALCGVAMAGPGTQDTGGSDQQMLNQPQINRSQLPSQMGQTQSNTSQGGQSPTARQGLQGPQGAGEMGAFSVNEELIGSKLRNPDGDVLGTVKDIVADRTGRISYLILAPAGDESGNQRVAIPWHALQVATQITYVLPMSRDQVAEAPTVSRGKVQSEVNDQAWNRQNQGYFATVFIPEAKVSFSNFDANDNGYLSKDEVKGYKPLSSRFNRIDQDGDQRLSRAEIAAFIQEQHPSPGAQQQRSNPESDALPQQ